MSLQDELGLPSPIKSRPHEAMMNVVLTAQLLAKEGARILRPLSMTDSQFNVLMLLQYQSERGEMNQTELGRMLLVNRSNVTGLVDRMEEAGWVQRSADANDRRVNRVRLTGKGKELLHRAEQAYRQQVESVMGALAKDEQNRLCEMLERIRRRLPIQNKT